MWKIQIAIAVIIAVTGYALGRHVPIKDQLQVYDALRNTSSIIFAVMGAWLAILYPVALTRIFGESKFKDKDAETEKLRTLFPPLIYSTIVIAVVLVLGAIGPALKQIKSVLQYREQIRGSSYAIVAVLSLLQVVALVYIVIPIFTIQMEIRSFLKKEDRKARLHSRVSKKE